MCYYRCHAQRWAATVALNNFGGKWRGFLCSDIDDLSLKTYFFRKELATPHLSIQDGEKKLTAGPFQREC